MYIDVFFKSEATWKKLRYDYIILPDSWRNGPYGPYLEILKNNFGSFCFDIADVFEESVSSEQQSYELTEDDFGEVVSKILSILVNPQTANLLTTTLTNENLNEMTRIFTEGNYQTLSEYQKDNCINYTSSKAYFMAEIEEICVYRLNKAMEEQAEKELYSFIEENGLSEETFMEFDDWFNQIEYSEFRGIWYNPKYKDCLKQFRRFPGGYHEWIMVAETLHAKELGVPGYLLNGLVTPTHNVCFKGEGRHGSKNSTKFHIQLRTVIQNSENIEELKANLKDFIEAWLQPGQDKEYLIQVLSN